MRFLFLPQKEDWLKLAVQMAPLASTPSFCRSSRLCKNVDYLQLFRPRVGTDKRLILGREYGQDARTGKRYGEFSTENSG